MCSGRVDLEFILRAFSNGMDGVFIGGCRLGECNYITHGNYHALNTAMLAKRLLEHIGLDPDRLRIDFMSAGDGGLYTEFVDSFTSQVSELGPLGEKEGLDEIELKARLEAVRKLIPYIKVAKGKKLATQFSKREEYDELYTKEEIDQLFDEVVSYYIDPEKCQACGMCRKRCPVEAIVGAKKQVHVIDQDKCIKCGTCFEACPSKFSAVTKISGKPAPPPLPEDQREVIPRAKAG
ncbi:iron-sulfur protein [Dethiosulfatarculus sandiegensis]|uniref:Iron-sulfur protein n=2 Tax=Dethiosulfatarculus sandiegensis TaxID=1429043 RepID=A0A0D2JXF3_9BACT|nr:iron-sulfur protein [Dethiosulfatarculus sandiegensis]